MSLIDELHTAFDQVEPQVLDDIILHLAGEAMPSHATLLRQAKKRRALEIWEMGGVTTTQVAERIGVDARTARRWINGS